MSFNVSEGGLEGVTPLPPWGSSSVPSYGYQRRDQHYQPTHRGQSSRPRLRVPEPHAGATPYSQYPSAGLVWPRRRRPVAGTRRPPVSMPPPVWWRAATFSIAGDRAGQAGRSGTTNGSRRSPLGAVPTAAGRGPVPALPSTAWARTGRPIAKGTVLVLRQGERTRAKDGRRAAGRPHLQRVRGPLQRHLQSTGAAVAGDLPLGRPRGPAGRPGRGRRGKATEAGVLLVGTTKADGSARISGVEPLVMGGELWLSMMTTSTRALDLKARPARLHQQHSHRPRARRRGQVTRYRPRCPLR